MIRSAQRPLSGEIQQGLMGRWLLNWRVKLEEAVDQLDSLTEEDVIFAKRPWQLDSEALIGLLAENLGVPKAIEDRGFDYFLEVPVANEVLEVFGSRQPSAQERRALLLYGVERVKGIEPSSLGWEPRALPLSYTRADEEPHRRGTHPKLDGTSSLGAGVDSAGIDGSASN
jgi:hypothetical protein